MAVDEEAQVEEEVEEITKIEDLTPDPGNANEGTERGLAMLENSLQKYGAGRSILVDKDGVVIAGNKTLERAVDLGFPVRVIKTDGKELVVVQREDLDLDSEDGKARELAYADNRSSEVGLDWDLERILADVEAGVDFSGLWAGSELKELLGELLKPEPGADPGPQIDRAEELREKWQTARGQIWQIGKHRLMCGDSTSEEDVGRLMGAEKALLMATDPPYGDAWVQKAPDMHEQGYGHSRAVTRATIEGDDVSIEGLEAFLGKWIAVAVDCALTPPAGVYVWHRAKRRQVEKALLAAGFHVHQPIIWLKASFVIGRLDYHPRCEYALHGWLKGNGRGVFYGPRNQSDVWEFERESGWEHPTQKPVGLFEIPIMNHLNSGELAYEPFGGSGTQFVAAENQGVRCYGSEISEEYVAVTLERMAGMGLEPQLIEE